MKTKTAILASILIASSLTFAASNEVATQKTQEVPAQGGEAASQNEDASSLLARDLKGFPNSLIISAQCDILRDEALEFASRLAEFGINVRYRCIEGATHLFITKPEMKEAYCNALSEASEFVLKNSE